MYRSSLVTAQTKKRPILPELSSSQKIINTKSVVDQTYEIKIQTRMMENDIRKYRAMVIKNREKIKKRNSILSGVESQPMGEHSIKTASPNAIKAMKETITMLENSLEAKKDELEEIKNSDKLAQALEMQFEIQMLYLEKKRMVQTEHERTTNESIIKSELNRLQKQKQSTQNNESKIDEMQNEIDSLTDKLFAYTKNAQKILTTKRMKILTDNPSMINDLKKTIEKENEEDVKKVQENKAKLEKITELENKNILYLQDVVDGEIEKIKQVLEKMQKSEEEEEKPETNEKEEENSIKECEQMEEEDYKQSSSTGQIQPNEIEDQAPTNIEPSEAQ